MPTTRTTAETANNCRRQRRATTAPMAVGYQLLHLTRELPVGAIVVADDFGHPLAHAGDPELATILAESAMWSPFVADSGDAVDDLTLRRIQARYPEVEGRHVASLEIETPDARGARVLAIGDEAINAVKRAVAGIARITSGTADNDNAGPAFFDPAAPMPTKVQGPMSPASLREVGVRWVIAQTASR